jgi:hypothetical protein
MPKTEFYDAYGAAHPKIFGVRDESVSHILHIPLTSLSNDLLGSLYSAPPYEPLVLDKLCQRNGDIS